MGLRSLPSLLLQTVTLALRPRVLNIGANLTLTDGPNSGEATLAATGGGGGSVATDAIWDAKGDLAVGTGADTAAKLTAGSNGQVLTADSTQTTGTKWATPSGGSPTFVGCQVYGNADQSIPNNTTTVISFDQEGWDTSAIHNTVTNNSRLTIPAGKDGYWRFTAIIEFAANALGIRYAEVNVNGGSGAEQGLFQVPSAGAGAATLADGSITLPLVATDYVELQVYQNSGGALNVINPGAGNVWGGTFFQAEFLGAP